MIIGTSTNQSLQGLVWFSFLNSDKKKLHSRQISCILLSRSYLFTASDDGSLCICQFSDNNIIGRRDNEDSKSLIPVTFQDILVPEKDLMEKDSRITDLRLEVG
jgi:hypothetical protein